MASCSSSSFYGRGNRRGNRNSHSASHQPVGYPFRLNPTACHDITGDPFSEHQLRALRNDESTSQLALKHRHSPIAYANCSNSTDIHPDLRRLLRKLVQIQTINSVLTGSYRLENMEKIELDKRRMFEAAERTKLYTNEHEYKKPTKTYDKPVIYVVEGDCLEAGLLFKNGDCKPVVLNMASAYQPGGGWKNGAGAQEENLHRRTNLFQCLEDPYHQINRDWPYNVPMFGGIYTPNACVFRGSESDGYPFLSHPQYLSFIAVAAFKHPPLETNNQTGEFQLSGKKLIQETKKKIEGIFQIAIENQHDTIILSAFGCGAYGNPAKHIARLFKEVLDNDEQFSKSFRFIVFAIINDQNAYSERNPQGNVQPFSEVFQVKSLTLDELKEDLKQMEKQMEMVPHQ